MHMNRLALEFSKFGGTGIGEDEMADVNVRFYARVSALIHEAGHFANVVEQAEAERLEFKRNVNLTFVRVITQAAAGFNAPLPLRLRGYDLALPDVFAEHQQDVFCAPGLGKVNVTFAAFQMKFTDRLVEINQADGHNRQRNDGQNELRRGIGDETDFLLRNTHRFGVDVHRVEADARDVLEAGRGVHAGLIERAVDNAELHAGS